IWLTKTAKGSSVPSGYFGSKCVPSYSGLVDKLGNNASVVTMTDTSSGDCVLDDYILYYQAFQSLVSFLKTDPTFQSSSQILSVTDLAEVLSKSLSWNNCLNYALLHMEEEVIEYTTYTNNCNTQDSDPYYNYDPCCNTALQLHQCCRTRE